jgi:hypothetical protein
MAQAHGAGVDQTINPAVAALKPSKTMALTDLALTTKEQGADVSAGLLACILGLRNDLSTLMLRQQ